MLRDDLVHPVYWAGEQDGDGPYPMEGAFESLERASRKRGATAGENREGELAVTERANPASARIAHPDQDLQIEVFDPDPARALDLAISGDVRPAD